MEVDGGWYGVVTLSVDFDPKDFIILLLVLFLYNLLTMPICFIGLNLIYGRLASIFSDRGSNILPITDSVSVLKSVVLYYALE